VTAPGRRLIATRLSDIEEAAPPWTHYPHCNGCGRRVVSEDPDATRRARGYPLRPFDGHRCPHCGTVLVEGAP
jgi:hypothetical protein